MWDLGCARHPWSALEPLNRIQILLQLTGSRLRLSFNHLLIRIRYRSFLLAPVEFFAHDLHNTWQRFICRLHVQEAEAGPASDDIDGRAGVLFYGIQNLRKSTREEESLTSRICLVWCTSASMYGNSDTSLLPTIGHLCPVTWAILATSYAFAPYVEARCWATWTWKNSLRCPKSDQRHLSSC